MKVGEDLCTLCHLQRAQVDTVIYFRNIYHETVNCWGKIHDALWSACVPLMRYIQQFYG